MFRKHHHFLDSMIVLAMMKKQSYGFNTFAGLRVGEIQKKTDLEDWLHVPSKENVSDILTRGVSPDKLGPGSAWQCGPSWLTGPASEWPVTSSVDPIDESIKIKITEFYNKKSSSLTLVATSISNVSTVVQTFVSGVKTDQVKIKSGMDPVGIDGLICRCGSLEKLIRCMAYYLRVAGRACRKDLRVQKGKEISSSEYEDAFNYLVYWEQNKRLTMREVIKLVPKSVMVKLNNYNLSVPHINLGGRVRNFPVNFSRNSNIPIIPNSLSSSTMTSTIVKLTPLLPLLGVRSGPLRCGR